MDVWIEFKQSVLMPTGHRVWATPLPHSLCCLEETTIMILSQGWGWVVLNLQVFANGFEDGKCYLSAKYLLFVVVPNAGSPPHCQATKQ